MYEVYELWYSVSVNTISQWRAFVLSKFNKTKYKIHIPSPREHLVATRRKPTPQVCWLYMDFLITVFLYLLVTLALKKILGLVLASKSGLKVPFLPLLSAEVGHTRPRKFEFKQKGRQTAITICRGLSHPTGWAALPSDNILGRFFQGWRNPLMIYST